jgi:hypothetical protein
MLAPWVLIRHGMSSGVRAHALLEYERTNQEKAKEDYLHDKAADDNILAGARGI